MRTCEHLDRVVRRRQSAALPSGPGCVECLARGDWWVHLRLCLTCGHVGCCDDSPNRHARAHFHGTGHPVIKSFEPGENWAWCFADQLMARSIPAFGEESPTQHYSAPAP